MSDRNLENFRLLVFLSGVSLAISVGIAYLPMPISDLQLSYADGNGADPLIGYGHANLLWYSWLALYTIAHVLAFFYMWFARPVFLLCFGLSIGISVTCGLFVGTPWVNTAWSVHYTIATFAIGMLFFSPAVRARTDRDWLNALTTPPDLSPPQAQLVYPPDTSN